MLFVLLLSGDFDVYQINHLMLYSPDIEVVDLRMLTLKLYVKYCIS